MIAGALALAVGLAGCDDVPVSGGSSSVALDRHVLINNQTGRTIWSIHGSRTTTNSWEEDILGQHVLQPGQSANINFNDGTGACMFDFRFVFRNGQSIEHYGINVCTTATYTVR